jgi:ubiquitin carboxyl-terminal hydrolase 7
MLAVCHQVNDRYEYPEMLDLDVDDRKYQAANADRTKRNMFKLHSVLVHSGNTHGGHYYAFSRPDGQQWLRFDDEKVAIV